LQQKIGEQKNTKTMKKATFKEWDLDKLDAEFGLKQIRKCQIMQEWETYPVMVSDYEKQVLGDFQEGLILSGKAWNEVELENKFISPLITFTKIDNENLSYFLERTLQGVVGGL